MKNRVKLNVPNLKDALQESGIKKQDVAAKIGVSRETFSRWLSGRVEYIEEKNARKLGVILNCAPSHLSPEIPVEKYQSLGGLDPQQVISADTFVKIGLFSDQWQAVLNLFYCVKHPKIVKDHQVTVEIFKGLKALLQLSPDEAPIVEENDDPSTYELFDIIARKVFLNGVQSLLHGNWEEADQCFRRVLIQGQSEWIVALSYLGASMSNWLNQQPEKAKDLCDRGLAVFSESFDDLSVFASANLHLMQIILNPSDEDHVRTQIADARKDFSKIGYLHGEVRLRFYQMLLDGVRIEEDDILDGKDITINLRRLPPLYRFEALYIYSIAAKMRADGEDSDSLLTLAHDLLPKPLRDHFTSVGQSYEKSSCS
ncbi:helix-turn-helix domain-containing protein [Pseudobacteriovorax antillogorgiicola]|uniref:DNA-binding transcriptional regulator, XRE family n=1 Tax=Pseudobacteriovorax antillogorgiicola TaxID=1513793 RepID=A0A1Y6BN52_9BACT|nr:helix-turn-helix transcriptional regulator [Pseudobacteriovorax antillogorgiicola]TCS55511.1 DNA-binding Xre family transcriptional regulator [Pseudobacteriovorax antillogorgiicola]SMF11464.1 DNA-binding transcriptional regulator, XRE family [Pseudobacteriovorax antillogorgiicola]